MIWKLMHFLPVVSYCDPSEKKKLYSMYRYLDKIVLVAKQIEF